MNVNDLRPRGYCHGVRNALAMITKVINDKTYPRPITVLGTIVHNQAVGDALAMKGVISLFDHHKTRMELLEQVHTGTLILTAHGTADEVELLARQKGLVVLNAVCRDVRRVHDVVKEHLSQGDAVIYVGHQNHPEPEAVLAIANEIVFVETADEVRNLPESLAKRRIFVTNQTTLSVLDLSEIFDVLARKFSDITFDDRICSATRLRQEAVMTQPDADLLIVVGDPRSSNANRLRDVAMGGRKINAYLVTGAEQLVRSWFDDVNTVNVTSGASTPEAITQHVIDVLRRYQQKDPESWRIDPLPGPDDILNG